MKGRLVALACMSLVGCFAAANADYRARLDKRAAFDLRCEPSQLKVVELATNSSGYVVSYGVDGCGRRAVYVLNWQNEVWILNSPELPATDASAAGTLPSAPSR